MKKFTYKVFGINGDIARADFCFDGILIKIESEEISEATDSIRQYLADNSLKCQRIELIKIEILK